MSKKLVKLTEEDLRNLIKSSVNKILNEMPTGVKVGFKDDRRDVLVKFRSRARNPKFGLCKSDQRQLGVMYAEAFAQDREEVAQRIYDYAASKQHEYARMNSNGDEDLEWNLYTEMSDAFSQGDREYGNEDIWTDDDPQFSYWNNSNQFPESKTRIGKIIRESIKNVLSEATNEVKFGNRSLHGNNAHDWETVKKERFNRIHDIDDEIEKNQQDGYTDDLFGTISDLEKEKKRNIWNAQRDYTHSFELDGSYGPSFGGYQKIDNNDPEARKEYAQQRREWLKKVRPDMPIKTKSRDNKPPMRIPLNVRF
jgi:hypothetical protein